MDVAMFGTFEANSGRLGRAAQGSGDVAIGENCRLVQL